MTEFELKLEIPAPRFAEVEQAMARLKPHMLALRAVYFDTADGALARQGITIRIRQEGDAWYQTAKAPGRGPLDRLEHNVPLPAPAGRTTPAPDPALHADSALGPLLSRALNHHGAAAAVLVESFRTDVRRQAARVSHGRSVVEIALDCGEVRASGHTRKIRELELELKDGTRGDAIALARAWRGRHGLWLSVIAKSDKGRRLSRGMAFGPPVTATHAAYGRGADAREIAHASLASSLRQVTANASELGAGSRQADHVHQLRVGIRRTRTALRELEPWLGESGAQAEPALVAAFRALGRHRDLQVAQGLAPVIETDGGPSIRIDGLETDAPGPGSAVRSDDFQDAVLFLLGLAHDDGAGSPVEESKPRKAIRSRLRRLHRQVVKDGSKFAFLEETRRHRVRKRLKRLRYLGEFTAPLFPAHRVRAFLEGLKPVQDALGRYTDELMAAAVYRGIAADDPHAWFGVGWLSARRERNAKGCRKALLKFARMRPFWD